MLKRNRDKDYKNYIEIHIGLVKRAFDMYGALLCACLGMDIEDLRALVLKHDESKFSEEEFEGYRKRFYPVDFEEELTDSSYEFQEAWIHHYKNNPHHPEYWVNEDGSIQEMEDKYIAEMVLDWIAMGLYFGGTCYDFYWNKDRKEGLLGEKTRLKVEDILRTIKEYDSDH